jgi:hypothetical protein
MFEATESVFAVQERSRRRNEEFLTAIVEEIYPEEKIRAAYLEEKIRAAYLGGDGESLASQLLFPKELLARAYSPDSFKAEYYQTFMDEKMPEEDCKKSQIDSARYGMEYMKTYTDKMRYSRNNSNKMFRK